MTICLAEPRRARGIAALVRRALLLALLLGAGSGAAALECRPLAHSEPATHERHDGAAALFWRVTSADGAESMLFGTMHVYDPRLQTLIDRAQRELASRDAFVMEVVLDAQAVLALQGAMFYRDGKRLDDLVGEELAARAGQLMTTYGVPAEMVTLMKPWAVFTTLSAPPPTSDGMREAAMDMQLMSAAVARGTPVTGLETVAEQVAVFESIPAHEQGDMLREMVCHYDTLQSEIDDLVARYAAEDLAGLTALSLSHVDAARETFMEALIGDRNRLMRERLEPLLERGGAFIAVGALHLPGRDGLLNALRARGYTVAPAH